MMPSDNKAIVLYVENEFNTFELVRIYLSDVCSVDNAVDSGDCLRMAAGKKYSLILMDINLGNGPTGLETAKMIRKIDEYRDIPIVAVTAFAMAGDEDEFLSEGCTHYLSKPFKKKELIQLVSAILGGDGK